MDIVQEIKKQIHGKDVMNFGVGVDINKLILIMNNRKTDSASKDRLIKSLTRQINYYRNFSCNLVCEKRVLDGTCPKTCINTNPECKNLWCSGVVNSVDEIRPSVQSLADREKELQMGDEPA